MNTKPRSNKKYHAPKPMEEKQATRPHCKFCGGVGAPGEKAKTVTTSLGTHYRIPISHTQCEASLSLSLRLEPNA